MEDNKIEYKIDIPEKPSKLKGEIVSFLNTEGGEIHLGVRDDGTIDQEMIEAKRQEWEQKLSNWIFDAFSPNATNLIQILPNEIPFKIKVLEGKNKPYFLKKEKVLIPKEFLLGLAAQKD
ncbi:hypothetical protein MCANUF31_01876 [Mycoplasmopsis canis UF31]|uniref:AlbA family DNA-binding domain-containing protein n=1 Tax=Mycoplasmopsis canis TaxID=29555 RepID=UPI00025AEFE8|nr:ATP-binding protein [Mycoplasmopsis canis]EIE40010.1 hypothetical protein MCANUF31_01876 [Mycoplasmopsis canis UF31]